LAKQSQVPQNSASGAGGKSGKSEAEIKEEEELQKKNTKSNSIFVSVYCTIVLKTIFKKDV